MVSVYIWNLREGSGDTWQLFSAPPSLARAYRVQWTRSSVKMAYIDMSALEIFDRRIAAIHGPGGAGGDVMDVRHEEFMAMADAFLGQGYDRAKLAKVESLQLALQEAQAGLYQALSSHRIDRRRYVDEVNRIHNAIAQQCEAILGASDFVKLFGATPAEISGHIDKEVFLAQA